MYFLFENEFLLFEIDFILFEIELLLLEIRIFFSKLNFSCSKLWCFCSKSKFFCSKLDVKWCRCSRCSCILYIYRGLLSQLFKFEPVSDAKLGFWNSYFSTYQPQIQTTRSSEHWQSTPSWWTWKSAILWKINAPELRVYALVFSDLDGPK